MATTLYRPSIDGVRSALILTRDAGADTCQVTTPAGSVTTRACTAAETNDLSAAENTATRAVKIAGAGVRAAEIRTLSQNTGARGVAAWTQPQRLLILDAIGDMANMLSWLAADLLNATDPPA